MHILLYCSHIKYLNNIDLIYKLYPNDKLYLVCYGNRNECILIDNYIKSVYMAKFNNKFNNIFYIKKAEYLYYVYDYVYADILINLNINNNRLNIKRLILKNNLYLSRNNLHQIKN